MASPTRRSVLGSSLGLAAAGVLAGPDISKAEATTTAVSRVPGSPQQEDVAFCEKATGGTPAVDPTALNVSELLLEYLKLEGVRKLFGIPGAANGPLLTALYDRQNDKDFPKFIVCRHETGAAFMAHGYSVVTVGPAGETSPICGLCVVLTTSGPGATNALTGAVNAQLSGASLLMITGEVPQKYFGRGYLQEGVDSGLSIDSIYRSAVKYSAVVSNPANFPTLFEQALREACSQPGRAAHISLPMDVAGIELKDLVSTAPTSWSSYRSEPSAVDVAKVAQVLETLINAERPLILLGNGCRRPLRSRLQKFKEFVEAIAVPVVTTPDAKGIFPETHDTTHTMSLRNYGICACQWPELYMTEKDGTGRVGKYDALLVLGSSLGELATYPSGTPFSKGLHPRGGRSPHFIQVDLDPSVIGRNYPVTLGIVAEIGAFIDELCQRGAMRVPARNSAGERRITERCRFIQQLKSADPFADGTLRASEAAPVNPAALARILAEELKAHVTRTAAAAQPQQQTERGADAAPREPRPREAHPPQRRGHIFVDSGNCFGWSLHNMVIEPPLEFHISSNMGPMGVGVAAVIGGRLGSPQDACVAFVGDGAFLMHGAEVSTAVRYNVGAVWVVLADNDLAMVSQGQKAFFKNPDRNWSQYFRLDGPDQDMFAENLAKFAEGLGAAAFLVTSREDADDFRKKFKTALDQADKCRPQVIVVAIDRDKEPPYPWA